MTLRTGLVSGLLEFLSMWIVARSTGHTCGVLGALQERTPNKYFALLLTVGVIQTLGQRHGQVMIE
jgi:hypothetical protein